MKTTTMNAEATELEVEDVTNEGALRRSGVVRAARRSTPEQAVAASMVDALEDILKWERQSERALRVANDDASS